MKIRHTHIQSDGAQLQGNFFEPKTGQPGVLFVHGWSGNQTRDARRSQELAELGCVCLTFDLRGHGKHRNELETVTPEQNLRDLCSAYDVLVAHPDVDSSSIAVIGSSYGAYLSVFLSERRDIRWLALRAPALYRDEDWEKAKHSFDRQMLEDLRSEISPVPARGALAVCGAYRGDVLIVESEQDEIVAHPAVASYFSSFVNACSVTYRVISGADHALTKNRFRSSYNRLLMEWFREMVFNAR